MRQAGQTKPPLAYVVSRFPMVSETFVLRELDELATRGWPIVLVPLLRERPATRHTETARWEQVAWYTPFVSIDVLLANLHALVSRPRLYLGLWGTVLRETWGCPNYLIGAIGILPKAVYLASRLRQHGVRHVHAHFASHPTVAALVMSRLAGLSFSFTAHAHDLYVHQHMLATKVRHAAFVVTISEFNRGLLARYAGEEALTKVRVIRCGVDTAVIAPSPLPKGGRYRILSVASLQPYKGLTYLVWACWLLRTRGLDFECRVVGGGELRARLEGQIRRLGLQDRVRLLGPQPQQRVLQELERCQVFVLPSVRERNGKMDGLPVALMEAMAAGRPVVASRLSGIPELVQHGETGLLVEPGDPSALADALERLAHDRALAMRLAAGGRRLVETAYDLRNNVRYLEECFLEALPGSEDLAARYREVAHV